MSAPERYRITVIGAHAVKRMRPQAIPSMDRIEQHILRAEQGCFLSTIHLYLLEKYCIKARTLAEKEVMDLISRTLDVCTIDNTK